MKLETTTRKDVLLLTLGGRFDAHAAPLVRAWFDQATAVARPHIVVDLSGVPFLDSAALAVLARGRDQCRARHGSLTLRGLTQAVQIIFELTMQDRLFAIEEATGAAVPPTPPAAPFIPSENLSGFPATMGVTC